MKIRRGTAYIRRGARLCAPTHFFFRKIIVPSTNSRNVSANKASAVRPMGSTVNFPLKIFLSHGWIIKKSETTATMIIKNEGRRVALHLIFDLNNHKLNPNNTIAAKS